ncbi:MAG TPA: DinB family protein [Candidatus Ruania gallistercoris]|uniref:DinB family protein n=1 Tax=Candidatus Ruania gallistercoris TaxID=2838746 RepID=A0A9D2EFE8_9MICO|nr:DinB family protein [Candidatus Ruania gallistercoris]
MTAATDLLSDGFARVEGVLTAALDGLGPAELEARIDPDANSIAWLAWHLTRVQDDHVAEVAGTEQVWTADGWAERFGLPFEPGETGFGHSSADVAQVRGISAGDLLDYHRATRGATERYLATLTDGDLGRVVDDAWDPPVTLAVRLMSVLGEDHQHAGQIAYLAGVLARRA